MKKALILAYDFPPYVSVGALRPYSWYKYMSEYGYYPIIVTRQWANKYGNKLDFVAPGESPDELIESNDSGTIIRSPYTPNFANRLMLKYGDSKYKLLRRAISAFFFFSQYVFFVGPKSKLYFSADNYLKNNHVDIIIATGEPFVLFKYAAKLSKKYKVDWVADYRDAWTQNIELNNNPILKLWSKYFEKKTVGNAKIITTVSKYFKNQISQLIRNKEIQIISNGFDYDEIQRTSNIEQNSSCLTIGFAGSIYEFDPIESVLTSISHFISGENNAKVKLNFYGINNTERITNYISKNLPDLKNIVSIHPKMSNEKVLEKLAESNLLLLFNYYSIIGTKIYNYLALNRAILFCYSNDKEAFKVKLKHSGKNSESFSDIFAQEKLIRETNSGYIIEDEKHLDKTLIQLYKEFSETGKIKCNTTDIDKYSRKCQVKNLCELLDGMD